MADSALSALDDHNARVRRLARAYAPKYRPIVLALGYAEALEDHLFEDGLVKVHAGWSFMSVETIRQKTARYSAEGKTPLSERTVQRLMAEMRSPKANALEAKERFSEATGRQRSSFRKLSHDVAVNRFGWSIPHDWDAPLEDESQNVAEPIQVLGTPRVTPHDTPHDTPITTSELDSNLPGTDSSSRADDDAGPGKISQEPTAREVASDLVDVAREYGITVWPGPALTLVRSFGPDVVENVLGGGLLREWCEHVRDFRQPDSSPGGYLLACLQNVLAAQTVN